MNNYTKSKDKTTPAKASKKPSPAKRPAVKKAVTQEYDAKLDSKKRLTIRGGKYDHYKVVEFENGDVLLKPQILLNVDEISEHTLQMITSSMENFKKGKVSEPVDLSEFNFDDED